MSVLREVQNIRRNQTMKSRSVQKMLETETLVLTKGQLFWHYCIIGFLIPPIMNIIHIFQYYVTHTYQGVRTVGEMAVWSYLFLIPATVFVAEEPFPIALKILWVAPTVDTTQ